jgi:hypothetical protein
MLTIERTRRLSHELSALPVLTRIGLALIVFAGAFDVAVHLAAGQHAGHTGIAHVAHLVGIAGMALVMAGVVIHGVRRQPRRAAAKPGGLDPNAHR